MEPSLNYALNYEDYKLRNEWTFYEVYEALAYKKNDKMKMQDYLDNINTVFTFNNLIDFTLFWNNTNIKAITPLFTDPFKGLVRKIKSKELKIGSIAMFKNKIKPLWEEKENHHGGEYSIKLNGYSDFDAKKFADLWEKLIFTLVGDSSELVNEVI